MISMIALPVAGFLIGLFIITLGGGGGAVYVGILTVFFHTPPAIAASTSLATMIPTTAVGAFSHWKAGNANIRFGWYLLGSGILGAVVGSIFSGVLPQSVYDKISGLAIVGISVQMLVQLLHRKRRPLSATPYTSVMPRRFWRIIAAGTYGVFGGVLSGLIGISGSAAIVGGLSVVGCDVTEIAGTSVLVLLGIAITGFLMHLHLGTIDWSIVSLFLPGTVVGAFVGPVLLRRISTNGRENVLRPLFVVLMIGTGMALAFK